MNKIITVGIINQIALFRLAKPINTIERVINQSLISNFPLLFVQRNAKPNIGSVVAIAPPCDATEPTIFSVLPIITTLNIVKIICTIKIS